MPSIYAHYTLGKIVLEKIPLEFQEVINKNRGIFNIGLQGPDIFFFKDFGKDKKALSLAHKIHFSPFKETLITFTDIYKNFGNESVLAYILGYIGHFALDSSAHGFINRVSAEEKVPHIELETEFDRFLMLKDGINPLSFDISGLLKADTLSKKSASLTYKEYSMSQDEVLKAMNDYKFIRKIVLPFQKFAPFVIDGVLKKLELEDFGSGFYFKKNINKNLIPYVQQIIPLYKNAIRVYITLLDNYNSYLNDRLDLDNYFLNDFEIYRENGENNGKI